MSLKVFALGLFIVAVGVALRTTLIWIVTGALFHSVGLNSPSFWQSFLVVLLIDVLRGATNVGMKKDNK